MHKLVCKVVITLTYIFGIVGEVEMATAQDTQTSTPSYLTEVYGDWVVRCVNDPVVGGRLCDMTQELRQQDTDQRILAISVTATEDGGNITIVAPFGLDLSKGIQLSIANEALAHMRFATCLPTGCIGQDSLDETLLERMKHGAAMTIHLTQSNAQGVEFGTSLSGFTAAWNRLKQL